METIDNYLVTQRCQVICGGAGCSSSNDCKGGEEAMPPKDPALEMPKRLKLPILGTETQQLKESDTIA